LTERAWAILVAVVALSLGGGPLPAGAETLAEFTTRVELELQGKNPAAAKAFHEANLAREKSQWADAERLYRQVLALEPGYVHATRRLCHVVYEQGRRKEALPLCRQALAKEASPENRSQFLDVLLDRRNDHEPTAAELQEARTHASALLALPHPDWVVLPAACDTAIARQDANMLRRCVDRLESVAPTEVATHFYKWILALSEGDYSAAERALDRAHSLGLPDKAYASLMAETEKARPWYQRFGRVAGIVVLAWAAVLGVLFVLGLILSHTTLKVARRPPDVQTGESVGMTWALRRAYQGVILGSCVYYYASIPIVVLMALALAAGVIYAFFAIGQIPIKLTLLIVVFACVTVWAALKSLFVRARDEDPGDRLERSRHPRLRRLLSEVASQIGTRPVDNVYMTPGTDLAVTERGGLVKQLGGRSERCLILGAGVVEGMTIGPFRAILAHEYGHFSNRDTAGGTFALAVRRSLWTMAHNLAAGGAAAWYNPLWLFLNVFHRVFLRISQGATRLQEILADRWAAFAYGASAFEEGLRHVVERSIRFQAHANSTLNEVVNGKLALANLYTYKPTKNPTQKEIEEAVRKAIDAPASPYDSHPSPAERFRLLKLLPSARAGSQVDAHLEVWSLFDDPVAVQRKMTDRIRANVAMSHGVSIRAES
jgi:Zn-dependent protease with chaperone function/uncharacterized membrane protein